MEEATDYDFLKGRQVGFVIKELSLATQDVLHTIHVLIPYCMRRHGSEEDGINWDDGIASYEQFVTSLIEAVAGYAHLYIYEITKCKFLSGLLSRTFFNIEDIGYPNYRTLRQGYSCIVPCHSFSDISCVTRNADSYYKWLMYHSQINLK